MTTKTPGLTRRQRRRLISEIRGGESGPLCPSIPFVCGDAMTEPRLVSRSAPASMILAKIDCMTQLRWDPTTV
jgi:hypothetical protein